MKHCFTPEEDCNQDDDVFETPPGASKLLLLSIARRRRSIAQPQPSIQEHPSAPANLEPAVEQLQHYCIQQRQLATQSHQRSAYDFLIKYIAEMRPETQELHATLGAWARLRQTQAQQLRSTGSAPTLAEELEVAAQICEALVAQLHRAEQE